MGDIEWAVRSFGISLLNDTSTWIIAIMFVLTIINLILEVFHDNSK